VPGVVSFGERKETEAAAPGKVEMDGAKGAILCGASVAVKRSWKAIRAAVRREEPHRVQELRQHDD